jgi:DNA-binding PucR family transcriptional regulator
MADLLHTLRGYLLAGRNARAAAEALQIHRNTLPYRLRRIEEVLGVDLTDADDLFTLELAIRMRDARAPSPEGYDLSGSGDTG